MSENEIKMTIIRLAILGDSAVGKTSIINTFMNIEFKEEFVTTVGWDKMVTKVKLENGEDIKLSVWDTAGQERFRASALKVVRKSQGIALAFDLTEKKTFDNVVNWLNIIKDNFNNVPIVLMGNKCELNEKRQIKKEEAEELAKNHHLPYFETSAKLNININEAFQKLANDVYKKANKIPEGGISLDDKNKTKKKGFCGGGKTQQKEKKNKKPKK